MKNKYKSKYVFFISNLSFLNYSNISDLNNLQNFKKKEDKIRFKEKFSIPSKKRSKGKVIWFHGASVGEILSVIPLIEYYEKDKSINQIIVTSTTLSSSKVLNKFKFKKTIHQFYPIDHIYITKKFLEYWKPDISIFIDS